jgi:hypothetical protein
MVVAFRCATEKSSEETHPGVVGQLERPDRCCTPTQDPGKKAKCCPARWDTYRSGLIRIHLRLVTLFK